MTGWTDYVYEYRKDCFCLPASRQPMTVTVRDGSVTEVAYAAGADEGFTPGDAVPGDVKGTIPTVDGLFDEIQDGIDRPADEIEVTYDADSGMPTTIFIDYVARAADEELRITAGNLAPSAPVSSDVDREAREDLENAMSLWSTNGPTDYVYKYRQSCFCLPESLQPVMVTVKGGAVTEVVYAVGVDEGFTPGDKVPNDIKHRVRTVDGLFDLIQDGIDGSDQLTVTYDDVYGHPTSIFIDDQTLVSDDELRITISDLAPLTSSPTLFPSFGPSVTPFNSTPPYTLEPSSAPTNMLSTIPTGSTTGSDGSSPMTSKPSHKPTTTLSSYPAFDTSSAPSNIPSTIPTGSKASSDGNLSIGPTSGPASALAGSAMASPSSAPSNSISPSDFTHKPTSNIFIQGSTSSTPNPSSEPSSESTSAEPTQSSAYLLTSGNIMVVLSVASFATANFN